MAFIDHTILSSTAMPVHAHTQTHTLNSSSTICFTLQY